MNRIVSCFFSNFSKRLGYSIHRWFDYLGLVYREEHLGKKANPMNSWFEFLTLCVTSNRIVLGSSMTSIFFVAIEFQISLAFSGRQTVSDPPIFLSFLLVAPDKSDQSDDKILMNLAGSTFLRRFWAPQPTKPSLCARTRARSSPETCRTHARCYRGPQLQVAT